MDKFWKHATKHNAKIEYIATDLSAAFLSAVKKNAPDAKLVFDHFHVKKQISDTVDKVRRSLYHNKLYAEKKEVIKGTRWLLLKNAKDIKTKRAAGGISHQ